MISLCLSDCLSVSVCLSVCLTTLIMSMCVCDYPLNPILQQKMHTIHMMFIFEMTAQLVSFVREIRDSCPMKHLFCKSSYPLLPNEFEFAKLHILIPSELDRRASPFILITTSHQVFLCIVKNLFLSMPLLIISCPSISQCMRIKGSITFQNSFNYDWQLESQYIICFNSRDVPW